MKNNTMNSTIEAALLKYLQDAILINAAARYERLANTAFSRRSYKLDSELQDIRAGVAAHTRIPEGDVERFLIGLAKATRPARRLALPKVEGPVRRAVGEWSPGRLPVPAPVSELADWSPRQEVLK